MLRGMIVTGTGRPLLALDRAPRSVDRVAMASDKSVRTYDQEGRLRVEANPISKAAVNGYYGHEIPDGVESLGLAPDTLYMLLRDPEELEKAAPTFNNLPILSKHVPVSAAAHPKELVVGSTGSRAAWSAPYLTNDICLWTNPAVAGVESDEQRELSSAYWYKADMTPGKYEGVAYDGVMRQIKGNHVCLVDSGRAGPDVLVMDERPQEQQMALKKLSRRALVVRTAVAAYLAPKLAQDQKVDLAPLVAGLTAKNFKTEAPKLVAAVTAAVKGKLAQDANIADLAAAVDAFKEDAGSMDEEPEEAMDEDAETPEEKAARMEKRAADKAAKDEEAKESKIDKAGMDAAIETAAKATEKRLRAEFKDTQIALVEVRPLVGQIVVAMDSAADVYEFALKERKVDLAGVPKEAYRSLVAAEVRHAGARRPDQIAQDGAAGGLDAMFPGAARIKSAA